ncbi:MULTISPECIES: hypothetical protein [Microbispora]|uniref:hypothetical protein n=1 Tax=Microbispora TaxID=2005 RepID=UPI00164FCA84|nr:hypothetical protein [Microbispora sp. CSR-4]
MTPVVVRRLSGEDWRTWRLLRLAALAGAPEIFHGGLAWDLDRAVTDYVGRLRAGNPR